MSGEATRAGERPLLRETIEEEPQRWRHYDGSSDEQTTYDALLNLIAMRFRLLGEPLRLKLLAVLASGERNVGELVTLTGTSQPNVSKHLTALTQGGLVSRRKAGTSMFYTVADPTVLVLCDVMCAGMRQRFAAQAHTLGMETYLRPRHEETKEIYQEEA